jgi:hypothetical protein
MRGEKTQIGSRYGRLTVLEFAGFKVLKSGERKPYWHCVCDCGVEKIAGQNNLRAGDSKSCGCLKTKGSGQTQPGSRYGRLTVVEFAWLRESKSGKRKPYWHCVCDCGVKTVVGQFSLRRGTTKSCGCLKTKDREKTQPGSRYGKFTVLEFAGLREFKCKARVPYWHCLCDCGVKTSVLQSNLRYGHSKSCGCLARETSLVHVSIANANRPPRKNTSHKAMAQVARKTMGWIFKAIKRGQLSTSKTNVNQIGCTLQQFKDWIEPQWKRGMTWANHPTKWHVDHKMPLAEFDMENPAHAAMAMHYTNLQPLWAKDNRAKGARVHTHQPLLPMGDVEFSGMRKFSSMRKKESI